MNNRFGKLNSPCCIPLSFRGWTILCLLVAGLVPRLQAQDQEKTLRYDNWVYEDHIRTVQFYRGNDPLSVPFLYIGDNFQLTLEFDELVPGNTFDSDFWVDVISCDEYWKPSNLLPIEFLDGFSNDRIFEWRRSENTRIPFIHYEYKFPAEGVTFKRSGNYLLRVYRRGDESDLVLTRRLIVAGNQIRVEPLLGLSRSISDRLRIQRLDFNIYTTGLRTMNPAEDLHVVLLQNGRWDNAITGIRPTFFSSDKLEYQFNAGLEFNGGNEYRLLDIRSHRFYTDKMKKVEDRDSIWFIDLHPERPRPSNKYYSMPDFNGAYFIQVQEFPNGGINADYSLVRFTLKYPEPVTDGKVYVFGAMTDWKCKPEFQMEYNPAKYRFEAEVLLKQGVYNYHYVVREFDTGKTDEVRMEGSHFETENYYTILVYYRPITSRNAELIGISHINYYDRN